MIARPDRDDHHRDQPVPRRRNGRQMPRSMAPPSTPPTSMAMAAAGIRWMPTVTLKRNREDGADRDHLGVGEVHQPRGAVDQRQADRAHADDQPELDPVDEEPGAPVEAAVTLATPCRGRRLALGEVEQHVAALVLGQPQRQLLAVLVDQLDPFRKGLELQLDGVVAGSGKVDRERAVGDGGATADLVRHGDDRTPVRGQLGLVDDDLGALDGHPIGLLGIVGAVLDDALDAFAVTGLLSRGQLPTEDGRGECDQQPDKGATHGPL